MKMQTRVRHNRAAEKIVSFSNFASNVPSFWHWENKDAPVLRKLSLLPGSSSDSPKCEDFSVLMGSAQCVQAGLALNRATRRLSGALLGVGVGAGPRLQLRM